MALKPDGKVWSVKEQTFEDPVSGLIFQFEIQEDGRPKLCVARSSPTDQGLEMVFEESGEKVSTAYFKFR